MTGALREAIQAIEGDRNITHGQNIKYTMETAAKLYSTVMGIQHTGGDMAMAMICIKMARIVSSNAKHRDHYVDLAGYASILAEIDRED